MNLFGVMDVSASALRAERVRAEVVAANMANSETTRTAGGGPYRRHHVVFEQAGGDGFGTALLGSATGTGAGLTQVPARGAFAGGSPGGVAISSVIEDGGAPLMRFDPGHPDATPEGYVAYPDINPLTEMVDLMGATRSFGMNASAVQAEKGMLVASLDLLK